MTVILRALLVLMGVSSCSALAQEADEPQQTWTASAELGYVATSGNTDTDTLNLRANATIDQALWRHSFEVTSLNASDQNGDTAQRYTLSAQSDYKLEPPDYLFLKINYEDDRFSGFKYQATQALGFGRRFIDDVTLKLDLELGPGARQTKTDDGVSEEEALLLAAAKLDWDVSETAKFTEVLTLETGEDTRITKSVSGLSTQIDNNLSMKITYTYKRTSDVPVGFDKTDTETAVTLVYNF